jgi:hypothetical protein
MYALHNNKPGPEWLTLIPAAGKVPAVRGQFAPASRSMKRRAQHEARKGIDGATVDLLDVCDLADIGDAFSRSLIRQALLAWEGIGDVDGKPIEVTPEAVELFLADERLFEAADALYVMPIVLRDREKNGYAASPNGTGKAATPAKDTARSRVGRTRAKGAESARTARTSPRRPRGKKSGSS